MCYTVTNSGFDDDFADAACVYIGYHRSTDIYPITLKYVPYIIVIIKAGLGHSDDQD